MFLARKLSTAWYAQWFWSRSLNMSGALTSCAPAAATHVRLRETLRKVRTFLIVCFLLERVSECTPHGSLGSRSQTDLPGGGKGHSDRARTWVGEEEKLSLLPSSPRSALVGLLSCGPFGHPRKTVSVAVARDLGG